MAGHKNHIKLAIKNPKLAEELERAILQNKNFQLLSLTEERVPDLQIYEIGHDIDREFQRIQLLVEGGKVNELFLTAKKIDFDLLVKVMRLGVKEFLQQPLDMAELDRALERYRQRTSRNSSTSPASKGQIISLIGSKGGVGTTTVSVNLAVALSGIKNSHSVALLDMNTVFGEIPLFLEIQPKFHWGEITKNIDRMDDTFLMNVLSKHSSGVNILPSPAYLNGYQSPTPEIMERLLGLMRRMFDYVIVDAGQSTNETSLKILQISDTVVLVSILSLPSLSNANRLVKSFIELGFLDKNRIKIIINRYLKKGEISIKDAEKSLDQEMFWIIPNDYQTTMWAINNGKPLLQAAPRSKIAKNFIDLANFLAPQEAKEQKRWSFFTR